MKSIYSKLIFCFFITIVTSFTVAGMVSLRINNQQIEETAKQELISTKEFVVRTLTTMEKDKNELLELYARSSEFSIVTYSVSQGTNLYGEKLYLPSIERIIQISKGKQDYFLNVQNNIFSYISKEKVVGEEFYIIIQQDISSQKSVFVNSAMLILGCVFLTGSIVFLVAAEIIVRPISRLINATKELSRGNYNVRVDNIGEDEISRLNQSFNQMARAFAKQEETRQKFISDISHEFQTPLTSIQGFANILKEEDLPKAQREKYANIILYNSKRLSSLAKNMLQLTLLDREEIELEMNEYSIVNQMQRVISLQESIAAQKDIEIVLEDCKKDIMYFGDEQRLEQVWTNIISNAIKYTNEGGLITVSVKRNSKDIEVSIEDTGIGMSEEVISHIFERFYREDKARSVDGNGLGLSIVKSIVDLHHGTIDVLSQVDVGSTFIVKLPYEKQMFFDKLKF